ncbi:NAD-dependent dehydratase, partial [bacterium]|nr:NAD-dependent dehydratase [bacterium]
RIPKRPGEPDCPCPDVSRIKRDLGWSAEVSIEEGVARLLENLDYWRDAPVWSSQDIAVATVDWFKHIKA